MLLDGFLGLPAIGASMRTPNTISEAMENSSRPPAMRKAGSEMPSVCSSQSPTKAVPARIAGGDEAGAQRDVAARGARQALRDGEEARHQPDRIDHDGSVTSAEMRNSSGIERP